MTNEEELVAQVVAASGGEIIGRVRLQKVFYLLDRLGLGSGFSYAYHHYGPFSADLVDALDGAKAFRFVTETAKHRRSDGVQFSAFSLGSDVPKMTSNIASLPAERVAKLSAVMNSRSSTVLELAATIHWLQSELGLSDWEAELLRRKGKKTENGRTQEALKLLEELGLSGH